MTERQLYDLLLQARDFNKKNNITGLLLYSPTAFLQVVEGNRDVVQKLYDKIIMDCRHFQVTQLVNGNIAKREFGDWSMAFHDLSEKPPEVKLAFNDLLNQEIGTIDLSTYRKKLRSFLVIFNIQPAK